MSADSSPSTEPIPTPSVPNKTRRLFRHWKTSFLIGAIFVFLFALFLFKPFAGPRERLIGAWKTYCIFGGLAPVGLQQTGECVTTFNADGTLDFTQHLYQGEKLPYPGTLATYTWLDATTILIHWKEGGVSKMGVDFSGFWWSPELSLKDEIIDYPSTIFTRY